jgi:hypothetical protein
VHFGLAEASAQAQYYGEYNVRPSYRDAARYCAIALLIVVAAVACDVSTSPPNGNKPPCPAICDSLDIVNQDSTVQMSLYSITEDYILMVVHEFAMSINTYTAVYRRSDNTIRTLPYQAGDMQHEKVLCLDAWGIKEIDLEGGAETRIAAGYSRPSYSADSSYIFIRHIGATYKYYRSSGEIVKILDTHNLREYKPGLYIYYDRGFYLYDEQTGVTEKIEVNGLPHYLGSAQYHTWNLDPINDRLIVHIWTVLGDNNDNWLYMIDLKKRSAYQVLGRSHGSYYPRFSCNSELYVTRVCQPRRESYIIKVDPLTGCESIVVTARMHDDGSTEFWSANSFSGERHR